jgi:hypothetical protein
MTWEAWYGALRQWQLCLLSALTPGAELAHLGRHLEEEEGRFCCPETGLPLLRKLGLSPWACAVPTLVLNLT